jgi:hypothetical protein
MPGKVLKTNPNQPEPPELSELSELSELTRTIRTPEHPIPYIASIKTAVASRPSDPFVKLVISSI